VPHHLLALIRNMGTHGGHPFESVENLLFLILAVFRFIDNLRWLRILLGTVPFFLN
jgi:hypothetical protein